MIYEEIDSYFHLYRFKCIILSNLWTFPVCFQKTSIQRTTITAIPHCSLRTCLIFICQTSSFLLGCQVVPVVKSLPANPRDTGLIPGSGISPGRGNGTLLQHSCQKNSMDRGAWWAAAHVGGKEWNTTECLSSSSSRPCLPPSLPSGFRLSLAPSLPPSLAPALPVSLPCYLPRKSQRKPWVLLMQPWAAGACCPIPRSLPVLFSTQGLLEDCFFFRHSPANIFLVVPRPPSIWGTHRSRQASSGAQPGARSKAMPLICN